MRTDYFPPKAPLNAKFGFYFGYFAQLPTVEEFFKFKTLCTESAFCVQELDISSVVLSIKNTQEARLVLEVPLTSFNADVNPGFAYPIAVNGYVADVNKPSLSAAQIYVKDLQGQIHPFDPNKLENTGNVKRSLTKILIKDNVRSIYYSYSKEQVILGNGLYPLSQNNHYKNKLYLCTPNIHILGAVKIFAGYSLSSHSNVQ